ncbi:MAG: SGNH/GDSL hydrolase family protein [Clostridia bacterium]|nr:SGNH/GDSL hydrolase family protein [Clostridia bacterium]
MDFGKIDPNFFIGSKLSQEEYIWRNAQDKPFEIRGLAVCEGEDFFRVPADIAKGTNEGVELLATHTAGGRVRFKTNSRKIAVRIHSRHAFTMSHMPLTGISGVDIISDGVFSGSVRPEKPDGSWYEGFVVKPEGEAEIEINLPLYNGVTAILVGLEKDASCLSPRKYTYDKPVVYYGSSITQGGCASRPGNSYQGFISRWLDSDHVNLGFSGSGRGEEIMANFIAGIDMCAFVMDYDHNAPSVEHLLNTHERMFKIVRKAHPDIPVIIVTKPDVFKDPEVVKARRDAIYKTYKNAIDAGDKRVRFIDGKTLFGDKDRDACTVDGAHPNDLGFYRMAEAIYPVLKEALENK